MIRILFSGDLAPVGRVANYGLENGAEQLMTGIKHILQETDLHVTNLECPLTLAEQKIKKSGPHLKAHPQCIEILKAGRVGVACLANNHLRDFADQGVYDTIEICHRAEIDIVGGGANSEEAGRILYKNIAETRLAFINCCEDEFSAADQNSPGANIIDPISLYYDIIAAKKEADVVFLILHGGAEFYQLPTPELRRIFRYCADIGADAIIGHHSHVFSGYEEYNTKHLVYSLGNFLFDDQTVESQNWNLGLLAEFIIESKKIISVKLIPIEQCRDIPGIRELNSGELDAINSRIKELSEIIKNDETFYSEWDKLIEHRGRSYLFSLMNLGLGDRFLLRSGISTLANKRFQKYLVKAHNLIKCQTLRDVLLRFMKKRIR